MITDAAHKDSLGWVVCLDTGAGSSAGAALGRDWTACLFLGVLNLGSLPAVFSLFSFLGVQMSFHYIT